MASKIDIALDHLWSSINLRLHTMRRIRSKSMLVASGCIEWQGNLTNGYGQISVAGSMMRAHRLSYMFANSHRVGSKTDICHKCDNPKCINPEHLFAGTRLDNILDAKMKGRLNTEKIVWISQNQHPNSKLTNDSAMDILKLRSEGVSIPKIAQMKSVSYWCAYDVIHGRRWKNKISNAKLVREMK